MIDMPIGKDRYVREKQAVRKIENGGKPAVTLYEVLETFEHLADIVLTTRRASRTTGRTPPPPAKFCLRQAHPQDRPNPPVARAHDRARATRWSATRCTAGGSSSRGDFRFERQALHAAEITFAHPVTLEKMTLKAPLPPDITSLLHASRCDHHQLLNCRYVLRR